MRPDNLDPVPVDPDTMGRPRHRGRRRHARADILATIAIGGVIGATSRYALAEAIPTPRGGFPTATFLTNVVGSFLLGFVVVISVERLPPSRYLRPFLAIGVIGSFTTFSTFAVENVELVDHGAADIAAIYLAATLVAGITAVWTGIALARIVATVHQGDTT
jgi:CrcB protein